MGWPPSAPRPRRSPRSRPSCTARAGTRSCSPRSGERMRSPHSGSSALLTRACITRSLTVGMPKGRVLPFAFGMYTRLAGLGLYRPRDRSVSRALFRCLAHHTVDARGIAPAVLLGHLADRQQLRGPRADEQLLEVLHLPEVAVLCGTEDPFLQSPYSLRRR